MKDIIRVTVRMTQYNPRPFLVKDAEKIANWKKLAMENPWKLGSGPECQPNINRYYGIKIQKVIYDE